MAKQTKDVLILCDTYVEGEKLKGGHVYSLPTKTAEELVKGGLADDHKEALLGRPRGNEKPKADDAKEG